MYKLFFYDDINTTDSELEHIETFTGKIELHPLISINIDEDKFIDEEFFSFEAKRMELKFIDDGSPLANKFKEVLNCKDYLLREYPRTLEGITTAPTETQFINRKLKVDINNSAAFIGVPNIATHNVNYETMEHTVDFVSLPYLIFDNMDTLDMSMLLSYIANESYNNVTGEIFKFPQNILSDCLLSFLFNNGIKTNSLNYIIEKTLLPVQFNNALLLYSNNDFGKQYVIERGVYSIEQFNGFKPPYLASNSLNENDNVYHLSYHQTFKTKNTVPVELRFTRFLLSTTPINLIFRSEKEITINTETMECFEYDKALITIIDVANTVFLNNTFNDLHNKYNIDILIKKKNNVINKVIISFSLKTQDRDRNYTTNSTLVQNYFMTNLTNKLNELYTRSDNENIVFSKNNNVVTFTAYTGYPKITVSGEVNPKIKIDINDDKHGGKLITNSSNGIFNPDKFNIKDFFKYMLALSGNYMCFGYKDGKTLITFNRFKIDPLDAIRLKKEDILSLSSKNTFIELNKEFNDMDYSETDWHYLIRAIVFAYKSLAGALKNVYSCKLLKTEETIQAGLSVGKSVFILLDGYKKTFFINSVKEEEDIYELEIVEYLSDKQIPDILKQENIFEIIY